VHYARSKRVFVFVWSFSLGSRPAFLPSRP
jgi:hypothetical protein